MPESDMFDSSPGTALEVGQVLSVRGAQTRIGIAGTDGFGRDRPTVGRFLAVDAAASTVVGIISEVVAMPPGSCPDDRSRAQARVDLLGEIVREDDGSLRFRRGVRRYPAIGDRARLVTADDLRVIHASSRRNTAVIGKLNQDPTIPATIDVDQLLSKHFAVLGSTGVGKSSGVAVILNAVLAARKDLRVLLLDGHNEYGQSFGGQAAVIGTANLRLPFWIFNFEELTDVVYGGRVPVPEEVEILAELIPLAKGAYLAYKQADRPTLKRRDPRNTGFTVDTPVPYLLQDLLSLIDERMGKLENRSSRMTHHRLMMRIETLKNDPRYAFMFENANVGGDTLAGLLAQLFRLDDDGRRITVLQLAGLPAEVLDAVVCVVARMAFDFGLWSDGAMPMLFVCEEAHRYASADSTVFAPTRRALSKIAKEGRKYGVHLGLVTQRPAELDPTIISQCSTLFAMRMANEHDQALLRSAVSDTALDLLDFVSSLGTREVVGFGEGLPLPARFTFSTLDAALVPRSNAGAIGADGDPAARGVEFVRQVIARWRKATTSTGNDDEAPDAARDRPGFAASGEDGDGGVSSNPVASRLIDQARQSILRR